MKTKTIILAILLIITASHISCGNETPEIKSCDFDNPLTDLLWLKEKTEEIALAIQHGHPLTVSIYQCIYNNRETVFLVDKVNEKSFYNCEGKILETYSELNITGKELIWEMDNDFINTQYPCYCIMDTLRGEWTWVRTYRYGRFGYIVFDNEFKSIVRILSQNKDKSINYDVFVADTLFYRGSFEFAPPLEVELGITINLPHIRAGNYWTLITEDPRIKPDEDILIFVTPAFDGYAYFYEKNKKIIFYEQN